MSMVEGETAKRGVDKEMTEGEIETRKVLIEEEEKEEDEFEEEEERKEGDGEVVVIDETRYTQQIVDDEGFIASKPEMKQLIERKF